MNDICMKHVLRNPSSNSPLPSVVHTLDHACIYVRPHFLSRKNETPHSPHLVTGQIEPRQQAMPSLSHWPNRAQATGNARLAFVFQSPAPPMGQNQCRSTAVAAVVLARPTAWTWQCPHLVGCGGGFHFTRLGGGCGGSGTCTAHRLDMSSGVVPMN